MLLELKEGFSRFLSAASGQLHFAAHSHHYWPDVTLAAQERAWLDAAQLTDRKWARIYGEILPDVRDHIRCLLGGASPDSIAFAPNTHEFIVRLFSCFPAGKKIRILTTGSEFYSFSRQIRRMEEDGLVQVTRLETEPFVSFSQRFCDMLAQHDYDLVFVSHVFFDSGFFWPHIHNAVDAVRNSETFFVVDGYHGFMAVPTDLAHVEKRIFYMAGGYKYAMAGEGACFMHCPPQYGLRPVNTGWFAEFSALSGVQADAQVSYGPGGNRFMGATFDPTGLYRLQASLSWLRQNNVTVDKIRNHVHHLQRLFMDLADAELGQTEINHRNLVVPMTINDRGSFLTFRTPQASRLQEVLETHGIIVDRRGDRLRFGFGIYHDESDVMLLLGKLREILL